MFNEIFGFRPLNCSDGNLIESSWKFLVRFEIILLLSYSQIQIHLYFDELVALYNVGIVNRLMK